MTRFFGTLIDWGHYGPHGPMGPGSHWNGGGMAAGSGPTWGGVPVFWPLLWVAVIAAVVIGAVYLLRTSPFSAESDRAMTVLRERYARGELSDEEFETRAARLSVDEADTRQTAR